MTPLIWGRWDVVDGAEKIRVKFQNGKEFDAEIKGSDPKSDVAVIEIDAGGFPGAGCQPQPDRRASHYPAVQLFCPNRSTHER